MSKKYITMVLGILLTNCAMLSRNETNIVQIKTTKSTNHGSPVYVIIKNADLAEFLRDDYQKIVTEELLSEEKKDSVQKICLLPGMTKTLYLPNSKKGLVGIYCMFTDPGDEWKCYLESGGANHVKLLLGECEIMCINRF